MEIKLMYILILICGIVGGITGYFSGIETCPDYTQQVSEDKCVDYFGEISLTERNDALNTFVGFGIGIFLFACTFGAVSLYQLNLGCK